MVGTMIAAAMNLVGFQAAAAAFAINFAISTIVTRIFGQDQQGPQDNGTREQVPPSSVNAIPIVYGDAYLGGTFVDAVLSTDQKTMYYVLAVSCISTNGQFTFDTTKFYYGDRLISFDGTDQTKVVSLTDEAGNVDTKISGNLYINLYRSTAAGSITALNGAAAPSTVMGGSDIDVDLRWPSTGRQMNGLAFAIVKLNYNQDAGTTNLSPITFYAKHYLRNTGAAKPGDVWYDYITNTAYGGAVVTDFVDYASAYGLNIYSDGLITYEPSGGGSATQVRYRINGVLDAGQSVLSNLDKIMTCSDSWMAYNAAIGRWYVVINKEETTSYAFDDDNIIGEVRVSATDITQSINQVEAKFPDKGARDQPNFVNIETPDALRYQNEPDNKYSVTYDLCNDSVQAQYLANRILEQAREDLIVSFSTSYYGIQVDAGAVVSVTNSDYGWTNKLFRVVKVNEASLPDGSLGAKLELSEYSAAVYDDFSIKQYAVVPNSDLPSVSYFSPLSAPTVSASNPSSAIPNFNVSITAPASGRVTYSELYYTTSISPSASDWKLLSSASTIDGQPVTPSSTYVYANQVLPTGASTTETYYFSFIVGNDLAKSARSATSASFAWTPVASVGPTGPTGALGPTGSVGPTGTVGSTGPRNSQVFFFYDTPQESAPTAPTTAQVAYDFTTSTPTITTAGWSSVFNPANVGTTTADNKYWAVRVIFQETTYGGAYSETISSVFTWQNMDGLVTFTNLSGAIGPNGSGATFIDGGSIVADSLTVDKITSGTTSVINGGTFSLGSLNELNGYLGVGSFEATSANKFALLAFQEALSDTNGAAIGATTYSNVTPAIAAVATYDLNYNSFYSGVAIASKNGAMYSRWNRSVGTPDNTSLIPFNSGAFNNTVVGAYFAYFGTTASNRISEVFIANTTTVSALVGRRYDTTGETLLNEIYLNNGSYAAQATTGAIYSAGGYLPFTGTHDGLIEETELLVVGDIVVDYQVEAVLDPSNIVMLYKKSSVANQKGVIGVCIQVYETPPSDWDEYENTGEMDPVTGTPIPNPTPVPNPMYYPIPAGQKVIHLNALGEGTINVCGEGGNIELGDLIVTSSTPGKGMKQSDDIVRSITVAKARQAVTFSSLTDVQTIACIYLGG